MGRPVWLFARLYPNRQDLLVVFSNAFIMCHQTRTLRNMSSVRVLVLRLNGWRPSYAIKTHNLLLPRIFGDLHTIRCIIRKKSYHRSSDHKHTYVSANRTTSVLISVYD